jgi:hypothetical protein
MTDGATHSEGRRMKTFTKADIRHWFVRTTGQRQYRPQAVAQKKVAESADIIEPADAEFARVFCTPSSSLPGAAPRNRGKGAELTRQRPEVDALPLLWLLKIRNPNISRENSLLGLPNSRCTT